MALPRNSSGSATRKRVVSRDGCDTPNGATFPTNLLWIYLTLPTPYPLRGHVRHIHRRLVTAASATSGRWSCTGRSPAVSAPPGAGPVRRPRVGRRPPRPARDRRLPRHPCRPIGQDRPRPRLSSYIEIVYGMAFLPGGRAPRSRGG